MHSPGLRLERRDKQKAQRDESGEQHVSSLLGRDWEEAR